VKTQFKYSWQPVYLAAVSDLTARELGRRIATARSVITTRAEELANGKNEQAERVALMDALFSLRLVELYMKKLRQGQRIHVTSSRH
jgi:hypothetical protein